MTKSKSRQPSRQTTALRNRSNGIARTPTSVNKTTARVAVEDAPETTERDEVATTAAEVATDKATAKLSAGTAEASTEDQPIAKTVPALGSKITSKGAAEATTAKTVKEVPVAKTVKATGTVTSKTAPPVKINAKSVPNTPPLRAIPSTPAGIGGKGQSRDAAKYERRHIERQQRYLAERRRRRNRIVITLSVILLIAVVAGGTWLIVRQYTSGAANTAAPQGSYQEAIFNTNYPPVDSVYCDQLEGSIEHVHAYITMFINGQPSPLPANLGIAQASTGTSTCYYWLHTHDASGVLHIESPVNEVFTFGQLRDEWDQQFVSLGFAPELLLTSGWTIWVNGQKYNGSLSSVPLAAHNIITLAYNSPKAKPVTTYNWNGL
ncbi:MAG TPA: hypothetical protein VGD98_15850 [Ktedonobacteraceae bacterium]